MNIAQDFVVSAVLKSPAQCASIRQILKGDCSVSSEPKVEEHEVLSNDWSSRATEVEGERIFNRAKIVEFENEILWEEFLRTPDDPTNANLSKAELVPGGIDRDNSGDLEIPYQLGGCERGDETTRGRVDMDTR